MEVLEQKSSSIGLSVRVLKQSFIIGRPSRRGLTARWSQTANGAPARLRVRTLAPELHHVAWRFTQLNELRKRD
jgi:hypothetical protein